MTEDTATPPAGESPRHDEKSAPSPRPARRPRASGGASLSPPAGGGGRRGPKPPAPPPVIPEREPAPDRLIVGRVLGSHGVRGEFQMAIVISRPEHLRALRTVYLGDAQQPWRVRRIHSLPGDKVAIVRLHDLATPEDATALHGQEVRADQDALPPLPQGEYYHYQLIGLDVVTEDGTALGRLAEIIETGANDVYVVRGLAGETLLPAIEEVILEVDLEGGRMVVRPQEYY